MTKNLFTFFATFCLILLSQHISAQTEDAELWTSVSLGKNVFKKTSVSLEIQSRFDENASHVDKHLVDAGIDYELIKNVEIGVGYRFMMTNDKEGFIPEQRYHFNLAYKRNINRFNLGIRSRLQYGSIDFVADQDIWKQDLTNRNKIEVSYDIYRSPIKPFIASEVYYMLNDKIPWLLSKARYVAGANISVGNNGRVELFYMREQEYNVKNRATSHIYGVGYKYKF